ncbi:hypothetical protein [Shimia thalassica]|uniref:hypothetical protein n=1 Tax=Shimia thalassica TaxID=1715693 RepID=UPI002733403B|nr:hypothetical protein [Shimia thalassica]MDP2520847.1 hypothetical protein [Shimia thalassica]
MTLAHITDEEIDRGRTTLKKAKKAARKQPFGPDFSPAARSEPTILDPYTCISNMLALIIRKENDGWVAEIVLKEVPEGWPDVFGTPSRSPFASAEAARRDGFRMVNEQYQMERAGHAPKTPFPGKPFIVGNRVMFATYNGTW